MREDQHTFAAAYALDALPENRRRRFEQHLARCGSCQQEVRGLQETAAHLGEAAAEPAPAGLRTAVMAEVARTRQLPPVLPEAEPVTPRSLWLPRLSMALVAACLTVIVAVGTVLVRTQDRLEQAEARHAAITDVISAPDAQTVRQPIINGGTATVVVARSHNAAVFASADLPALPDTQGYEIWLMEPGRTRPAGMLKLSGGPHSDPVILRDLGKSTTRIALTVEPASGSPQPTSDPIVVTTFT